jgi:hypothetical protein
MMLQQKRKEAIMPIGSAITNTNYILKDFTYTSGV